MLEILKKILFPSRRYTEWKFESIEDEISDLRNRLDEIPTREQVEMLITSSSNDSMKNYKNMQSDVVEEMLDQLKDIMSRTETSTTEKIIGDREKKLKDINQQINAIKQQIKYIPTGINLDHHFRKQTFIQSVSIHMTEHCNLNCKGCDNLSPIAEEEYVDIKALGKDLQRLSELCDGFVGSISLLGGEPLLHPNLQEIFGPARSAFPHTNINVHTNGLLIFKMSDDFWNECVKYNIGIWLTKYPINLDYDEINRFLDSKGISYKYYNDSNVVKTLSHMPFDVAGKQNARDSFARCYHANSCVMLKRGKLFLCSIAPNAEHYNKRFGTQMTLLKKDYIDIYEAKTEDELLEYLCNPIPFCRYCDVAHRSYGEAWEISSKSQSEW